MLAEQAGEVLMARSMARRVMACCESSRQVMLDFAGVTFVSPSFVDEIFRVFQNAHPEVDLHWAHASAEVEGKIKHSRSGAS